MSSPRIHALCAALLFMVWAGCGGVQSRGHETAADEIAAHESEARPALLTTGPLSSVALTFTARNGQQLPVPMVEVTVGNAAWLLIVDSGTSHHALTEPFARALGATRAGPEVAGRDHSGQSMTATALLDLDVELAHRATRLRHLFAVPAPPPFEALGIGGFVAPHRLFEDGWVVLDLTTPRLLRFEREDAAQAWLAEHVAEPRRMAVAYHNSKPFVTVGFGAHEALIAELDTGGSQSEIDARYVASDPRTDEDCAGGIGVSGHCVDGESVEGQTICFAGREFAHLDIVARNKIDYAPDVEEGALLGMDVLRHCAVGFRQAATDPDGEVRVDDDEVLLVACVGESSPTRQVPSRSGYSDSGR